MTDSNANSLFVFIGPCAKSCSKQEDMDWKEAQMMAEMGYRSTDFLLHNITFFSPYKLISSYD